MAKSPRAFMLGDVGAALANPDDPATASEAAASADSAGIGFAETVAAAGTKRAMASRKLS